MREFWMLVGILLSIGILAGFSSLSPTAAFVANLPPRYDYSTSDFLVDGQLSLNLDEAFFDPDGDTLAFSVKPDQGVSAGVYGDNLIVVVQPGSVNQVEVTASDGRQQSTQVITVRGR